MIYIDKGWVNIMEGIKETYCYITLKENEEQYNSLLNRISYSKYLSINDINGKKCLCFMLDNQNNKSNGLNFDFENTVYPFMFVHDETNKMYIDPITNKTYPYGSINKAIGDYITEDSIPGINLSDNDIRNYINKIPFMVYKPVLEELEKVIKEGYKLNESDIRTSR